MLATMFTAIFTDYTTTRLESAPAPTELPYRPAIP